VKPIFRFKPQVANALTPEFLAGGSLPNLDRYREQIEEPVLREEAMTGVDVDLVTELLGQAAQQELEEGELDAWLAHRLHFAIRVPRRIAGDRWFWAWLALTAGRDFVRHRFKDKKGDVTEWRYTGVLTRNALSRLWWGAEMVRNGPDYAHVPIVFRRVRTAQWALELKYSWYRPAPIAFARVAETGPKPLSDDAMKALSKRINAYLSLSVLEGMGLDDGQTDAFDKDWRKRQPTLKEALGEGLEGPCDGYASKESIDGLEGWFRSLAEVS